MENLKVIEATEAYLEQDTSEGRRMVMRIVLPQLNNEEQIEFINDCIEGMNKNLEALSTNRKLKSAMDNFTQVFVRQTVLNMAMAIFLLFICLAGFSQNFRSIDYRGKTSSEVPKLCCDGQFIAGPHNWVNEKGEEDPNGEEVMVFRGYDFQNVWFQFNKKGICYKIIIRNNVGKPVVFDKSVNYKVNYEDGVTIYTIEK